MKLILEYQNKVYRWDKHKSGCQFCAFDKKCSWETPIPCPYAYGDTKGRWVEVKRKAGE